MLRQRANGACLVGDSHTATGEHEGAHWHVAHDDASRTLLQYQSASTPENKSNEATANASGPNNPRDTPTPTASAAPTFCSAAQNSGIGCGVGARSACHNKPPNSTMNMPMIAKKCRVAGVDSPPTTCSTTAGDTSCAAPLRTVIAAIHRSARRT